MPRSREVGHTWLQDGGAPAGMRGRRRDFSAWWRNDRSHAFTGRVATYVAVPNDPRNGAPGCRDCEADVGPCACVHHPRDGLPPLRVSLRRYDASTTTRDRENATGARTPHNPRRTPMDAPPPRVRARMYGEPVRAGCEACEECREGRNQLPWPRPSLEPVPVPGCVVVAERAPFPSRSFGKRPAASGSAAPSAWCQTTTVRGRRRTARTPLIASAQQGCTATAPGRRGRAHCPRRRSRHWCG